MIGTEARSELRKKRGFISDGKGGCIRCPSNCSCEKCKRKETMKFSTNLPTSLDTTEDGNSIDIPAESNIEDHAIQRALLKDLIKNLKSMSDQRPYKILSFVHEGYYSIQNIAKKLGYPEVQLKTNTIKSLRLVRIYLE